MATLEILALKSFIVNGKTLNLKITTNVKMIEIITTVFNYYIVCFKMKTFKLEGYIKSKKPFQ
jgi:hypothetical protein